MSRRAAGGVGGPGRSGRGASRGSRPAPAGRRGSTRPARRRPAASTSDGAGAADERGPARRAPGGLTGRAAVLGLVVCALVLSLAYPAKDARRSALLSTPCRVCRRTCLLIVDRRTRDPMALAALGVNPLTIVSVVNGGHNDALVGLAVLGGVLLAIDRRYIAAGAALAGAVLIKASGGLPLLAVGAWLVVAAGSRRARAFRRGRRCADRCRLLAGGRTRRARPPSRRKRAVHEQFGMGRAPTVAWRRAQVPAACIRRNCERARSRGRCSLFDGYG